MSDVVEALPPPSHGDAADQPLPYDLATTLAELEATAAAPSPEPLPDRVAVSDVVALPELFQPRGRLDVEEHHVGELERALKVSGALEPVLVKWVGAKPYLIDGHHRLEAYRRSSVAAIPVRSFEGSVADAVLEAGRANSRARLPMMPRERQSYAWRLVLLGTYSKRGTSEASGVSERQIAIMRDAKRRLGDDAYLYRDWWQAQLKLKGMPADPMSEEAREEWLEQQAEHYAARMAKEFSTKLATHPELAARTLSIYFGRKLGEVVEELRAFVDEPEEEVEEVNDEFGGPDF